MIICIVAIAICIIYWILESRYQMDWDLCKICSFLLFCTACILLLIIPVARFGDRVFINNINNVKQTLVQQRRRGDIENAAITQKIIEYNKDIAELKYGMHIFWIQDYTDPAIDTLTFIK